MKKLFMLALIALLTCGLARSQDFYYGYASPLLEVNTVNGTATVPVRALTEWLGGTLDYDAGNKTLVVHYGKGIIQLKVDSTHAVINDIAVELPVAVKVQDGLTIVPLRPLCDVFNISLTLDAKRKEITLIHPTGKQQLILPLTPLDEEIVMGFINAVETGEMETIKQSLEEHPSLYYYKSYPSLTALATAVKNGQVEAARFLQEFAAEPTTDYQDGSTAPGKLTLMHLAAESGSVDMLEFVRAQGLDVNAKSSEMGVTPLLIACAKSYTDAVKYLLEHGADVNASFAFPEEDVPDEMQKVAKAPGFGSPLMFATIYDNKEIIQLLLKYKATPLGEDMKEFVEDARTKGRISTCMNNLRQIGMTCMMWAQDNDEVLPDAKTVWTDIAVEKNTLQCPGNRKLANGYGYNALLSGKGLSDIEDPTATILAADSNSANNLIRSVKDIDQTRHGKGYVAVFLDGHVEFIEKDAEIKLQ